MKDLAQVRRAAPPPSRVLDAFALSGEATPLGGGTRTVWRVGGVVLKRLHPTSLEHHASLEVYPWLAGVLAQVANGAAGGFRLARPVPTRSGAWITGDGWAASEWLAGRAVEREDVAPWLGSIRAAAEAMHQALAAADPPQLLRTNRSRFGRADRWAWGEPPQVHPTLAPRVERLLALRTPLGGLRDQLVHGDLSPGNLLVNPGEPPGFIDFAPLWRPPEFALAMLANWLGPRQGDVGVLRHFADVPSFDQLLVRAALRMLYIVQEYGGVAHAQSELRAADLVIEHLT